MRRRTGELLVIEDDDDLRCALTELLSGAGHAVTATASASAAIAHMDARSAPVSLIVLDWILPGMTALEFIAAVAARAAHDSTPVLVLSGCDRITSGCGITAMITKPVRSRTLLDTIDRLLLLPRRQLPRHVTAEAPRALARTIAMRPGRTTS